MYATTSYRTNRRGRSARGPVNANRSGGIQGLVLVRDHSRAGVWVLKPTKPQAAGLEAQQQHKDDEDSSEA